jgi:dTDP-4-dehydrorhamnose 3,5-epimerase
MQIEFPKPQMQVKPTSLPGCFELQPEIKRDARGEFVKCFHAPLWQELGLQTEFKEEFYSRSLQGVIRGFHFQTPPCQQTKVVYCIHGEVLDVVLDIRRGSPVFGRTFALTLSHQKCNMLYIPEGLAHAFCTLSSEAVLCYNASSIYSPAHDAGIRWNSVGIDWPVQHPLISPRDQGFPQLAEFDSPFIFGTE